MRKAAFILLCLTAVASLTLNAQMQIYYSAGSDPMTKWRSLDTEHYQFIYPAGIDSLARVYAANMEAVRNDAIVKPLQVNPARTSVVLHPYTFSADVTKRSNSPLRLDMYTSPDMYDFMSEPWEYTTAISGSRHLGHAYLLDRGPFHIAWYVIGDNMRVVGDALWYNKYFWLGDAATTVTDLSHAGIGRNSDMLRGYRASLTSGDLRDYNRWKLGSYEYYTPDADAFGYILESNFRYQNDYYAFGRDWADNVTEHPIKSLLTGKRDEPTGALKNRAFKEYRDSIAALFQRDYDAREPYTPVSALWPAENYTEYANFVYIESENAIYALKDTFKEARQLVRIDLVEGTEQFLMFFSQNSSELSERDGKLYWTETVHKGPWELEDFSELFSYDIASGKVERLTRNTRYFHSAPKPGSDVIAVGENTAEGDTYLTILSAAGDKDLSIKTPGNGSIKTMTWLGDVLYCLIVTGDGLGLYSIGDDGWKTCIAPQWQNIFDLAEANIRLNGRDTDVILFTSDVDGVTNVYAYDTTRGDVLRLINSPYGTAEAQLYRDGGLIYSRYGKFGYSIVKTSAADFEMTPVDMSSPYSFQLADKGTQLSGNAYPKPDEEMLAGYQDAARYPSRPYRKAGNMFNVHSWAPFYLDMKATSPSRKTKASLGVMAMSQNKLGTVSAKAGYSYGKSHNSAKWMHAGHAAIEFRGVMPRVSLAAEVNTSERMEYAHHLDKDGKVVNDFRFTDSSKPFFDIALNIYQPFEYSMLGMNATVLPALSLHINNNRAIDYIGRRSGTANYFQFGLAGALETDVAYAAIYPRWGVGASVSHIAPAAFGDAARLSTSQTALSLSAYLPGFAATHGISVSLDLVNQDWKRGEAVFPTESLIELPRGFVKVDAAQFNSRNYVKGGLDYALPVNLGDFSCLGGMLYLRRLQAIPFFDYAASWQYSGGRKEFYSVGTDLMLDINLLHIGVGLSAGVRYAYNNGSPEMPGSHTFQFLFKAGL